MSSVLPMLQVIQAEAPAGRDARREPEHELVRMEVAKLTSISAQSPDWHAIEAVGSEILCRQSKDLQIATYVACAMGARSGIEGAARGMFLVAELLKRFGPQLYPLRPRARASALEWFMERTVLTLDAATAATSAQVDLVRANFDALREAAGALCEEPFASLPQLRRAVERLQLSEDVTERVAAAPQPTAVDAHGAGGSTDAASARVEATCAHLLDPFAGAEAGVDSTYEDEHIALRREIDKLTDATSGQPQWKTVYELAVGILESKSKDLSVAVYLAAALLELRGIAGFSQGVRLCAGLIERFWESMWPPITRAKRRAGAIEWLVERAASRLAGVGHVDAATCGELERALDELAVVSARFFGNSGPAVEPLLRALSSLPRKTGGHSSPLLLASREPEVQPATSASKESIAGSPRTGGTADREAETPRARQGVPDADHVFAPPPDEGPELQTYVSRSGAALVELARGRLEKDARDPRSYRWLRLGLWLRWEKAPVPNRRGRTDIDAPSHARRADLQKAVQAEAWEEVLRQSESLLARNPLWLEPHRVTALALSKLGDEYAAARTVVEHEARHLLLRLPDLASLQFTDGTPYGSAETLRWLELRNTNSDDDVALPSAVRDALLRGDASARAELLTLLQQCGSKRASFRLRLEVAQALLAAGKREAAVRLYRGLERDVEQYRLDVWEPDLARQVLAPLWIILSGEPFVGVTPGEGDRVCARLAQLAPTEVI